MVAGKFISAEHTHQISSELSLLILSLNRSSAWLKPFLEVINYKPWGFHGICHNHQPYIQLKETRLELILCTIWFSLVFFNLSFVGLYHDCWLRLRKNSCTVIEGTFLFQNVSVRVGHFTHLEDVTGYRPLQVHGYRFLQSCIHTWGHFKKKKINVVFFSMTEKKWIFK